MWWRPCLSAALRLRLPKESIATVSLLACRAETACKKGGKADRRSRKFTKDEILCVEVLRENSDIVHIMCTNLRIWLSHVPVCFLVAVDRTHGFVLLPCPFSIPRRFQLSLLVGSYVCCSCLSTAELARCRAGLLSRRIALESGRNDVAEARQNCRNRQLLYSDQLVAAMRMGECLSRRRPRKIEKQSLW